MQAIQYAPCITADRLVKPQSRRVASLTRHKACFHLSCANARLCFHSRPQARFHPFAAPSHTPQGVFSSFMRKRTFVFSFAPSGAFSSVFAPRGAAACSIQNPEHSEWMAEAGAFRFPIVIRQSGKRNPALRAGRNPAHAGLNPHLRCGLNLQAAPANDEAPKPFRFRGFIYPGSYLLSRDLSSDYHRRADVSLPGSEWDRVGPSGYDHQASALLRTSYFSLSGCHLRLRVAVVCAGCRLVGSRLTSAWLCFFAFSLLCTHSRLHSFQAEIACHRGGV